MTITEARDMLLIPGGHLQGNVWADLGCGAGTFTLALAGLLLPESKIYAVDNDQQLLKSIPSAYAGTAITTHVANFISTPLPFKKADGILMANALHYVQDQQVFLASIKRSLHTNGCLLVVEYDTDKPVKQWVPYPVGYQSLKKLVAQAGFDTLAKLQSRPSAFGGEMYSAIIYC